MIKRKQSCAKLICIYMITAILLFMQSCSLQGDLKSNTESEHVDQTLQTDFDGKIILGEKLENAYSVKNMQHAKDELISRGTNITDEIKTTHYYIRFTPLTEDHVEELFSNQELNLFKIPLDYEVLSQGSEYRDPELPAGQPDYQYATVTVDQELPNVPFEILEDLFIPDTTESSSRSLNNLTAIENESLKLTGNEKDIVSNSGSRGLIKRGRITVYDSTLKKGVPVPGLKITIKNGFRTRTAVTDTNGYYTIPAFGFMSIDNISFRFDFEDKFSIRNSANSHLFIIGKKGELDFNITERKVNFYAKLYRASILFYKYFQKYRSVPVRGITVQAFDNTKDIYCPSLGDSYPASYFNATKTIQISEGLTKKPHSDEVLFAHMCHELGHAFHDEMHDYFYNIKSSLKESFAELTEWIMASSNYPESLIKNYNSITAQNWYYNSAYTPFFIDLIDNLNQKNVSNRYLHDEVSGYDIRSIIDIVDDNKVLTIGNASWRIKSLPIPSSTTKSSRDAYLEYYKPEPDVTFKDDFSNGWNGWRHVSNKTYYSKDYWGNGVEAFVMDDRDNKAMYTYISDRGTKPDSIFALTPYFKVRAGSTYTLTFKARTESNRHRWMAFKPDTFYADYDKELLFRLNQKMKKFEIEFVAENPSDNARIMFLMGHFLNDGYSADVVIDDILIECTDSVI